jgi:hypothetical protein
VAAKPSGGKLSCYPFCFVGVVRLKNEWNDSKTYGNHPAWATP